MTLFWGGLALTLLLVVFHETDVWESGKLADDGQSEFVAMTGMELLSLASIFFGLRLFKFRMIHEKLVAQKSSALLRFGVFRLMLLEIPMLCNTYFYYMYMAPTFGYLAIILLLCLPFVYPTMNRCTAETTAETV